MVKKIKYSLIAVLVVVLIAIMAFFLFGHNFIQSNFVGEGNLNARDGQFFGATGIVLKSPHILALREKVYLGLPFERELLENSHIFTPEDLESLRFFALTGIKSLLQIKKDFLYLQSVIFTEENFVKDSILRHLMYVSNLDNKRNMEKLLNFLFVEEYVAAIDVANVLHFINHSSKDSFDKWKKDLQDYVLVDSLMKKYL